MEEKAKLREGASKLSERYEDIKDNAERLSNRIQRVLQFIQVCDKSTRYTSRVMCMKRKLSTKLSLNVCQNFLVSNSLRHEFLTKLCSEKTCFLNLDQQACYEFQNQQPSNSDAEFRMQRQLKNHEVKLRDLQNGKNALIFHFGIT